MCLPPSDEVLTDALNSKGFTENMCIFRQRREALFIEPRGGLRSTLALFLAMIEFGRVAREREKKWPRKPSAGPNKSADRLRRVGEHGVSVC